MYFTIKYNDCTEDSMYYTSAHEIRLEPSHDFYGCNFALSREKTLKFADFRTKYPIPTDDMQWTRFVKEKIDIAKMQCRKRIEEIERCSVQTVFNIWENSDMFAPVDKNRDDLL